MKLAAIIVSLLIGATAPLPASAAIPASPSPSLGDIAVVPVKAVEHSHMTHRRAPAERDDAYGAYGYRRDRPLYDWSHFSRSYHPGWPCVGGSRSDNSTLSAYPSWEVRPYCQ